MRVNSTEFQNSFGKYLSMVEKEDIIVVKNGRSVAKLTNYIEPNEFLVYEESQKYNAPRKIGYEEYKELVNSSEQRYELIDGDIYLLASPSFKHQVVVNEIAGHFYNYFKQSDCSSLTAPLDVKLTVNETKNKKEDTYNVVQPDITVICDQEKVDENNKYLGIPALIVEVLSPSTKGKDMVTKLNLYMKGGVSEYWIVDYINNKVIQYSFTQERDVDRISYLEKGNSIKSTNFKELKVSLADIFAEV